jgi:ribonuclease BN (tRNA processing enzyme)
MTMRLFIGGMRGSRPAVGSGFDEFGGDTTCLLLIGSQGQRLVLDAGTGMRAVAEQLAETGPDKVTVLFSHYHLDHLAGLTMNRLFYQPDWSFNLVGPSFVTGGVRDAVTRLLAPPYWPVSWERMNAHIEFAGLSPAPTALPRPDGLEGERDLSRERTRLGKAPQPVLILRPNLQVRGCPVPHPGGCMAYRIDDSSGVSVVFATDLEWRSRTPADEAAFLELCSTPQPADLLIMDAHFARANADAFVGWGHSSWEEDLEIAQAAGVRRALLGHHDPQAGDEALRRVEQQVKNHSPDSLLARAGQWLTIGN